MYRSPLAKTISHRRYQGLASLCLLFLVTMPCFSADSPILVYAEANAVDSRVVETSEGSRVEGFASELVRELLASAGYSADIRVVPWPRLVNSLRSESNVLGFNMTRTPSREESFHWIGQVRPIKFQLWGLGERIDELPRTLEEAREFRISAFREDVVEQYLLSRGFNNLTYVTDNSDLYGMLSRNRIDLIPYIQSAAENFMSRLGRSRDYLVPVIDLEEISTAHYLVMSKNSDTELVETLMLAFQELIDNGDFEEILGSTYVPAATPGLSP